jgi:hypothetical protein
MPIRKTVNLQLESRMRENRKSGSEGGEAQANAPFLPLSNGGGRALSLSALQRAIARVV